MSILNIAAAKFAWANNEALLINNKGWEAFNASEWTLDVFEKFEFQLKPASIQIGGQLVEIPQPLRSLDDLELNEIVYVPNLTDLNAPISFFNTPGNEYRLKQYLKQNLLHRVEAMAAEHAHALVKLVGVDIDPSEDEQKTQSNPAGLAEEEIQTPPLTIQIKSARRTTNKKAKDLQGHFNVIMESLKNCTNDFEVGTVCYKIESYGFTAKDLKELQQARDAKLNEIAQIKREAETTDFALKESIETTDNIVSIKSAAKKTTDTYPDKLAELIGCVRKAKTEVEAKAITRYTSGWTAEQIKPLETAIDERLAKLQQESAELTPEQPSIIVRILNAADLTELDSLEIDVAALDPFIQGEMNKYVEQRRSELTAAAQG
ncbi:hypothetical protein F889_01574 [Acinetobacter colistiniresistens]|uniref:Uncharacterized protein n=1 Tax=Acinetobacter colistiniresistens TaxID=280145 RepID=N9PN05_9GAMM|nr:hypothetical protein [Acinetobacter colistiniresistens]ENX34934.1 hypothetical protein F889_01574 [Acinetobacter colistiniresistens]